MPPSAPGRKAGSVGRGGGAGGGWSRGEVSATRSPCGRRLSAPGLLWALAVMMAVEEINNASTLLPGLRLGYDLFDTCSEPVIAMKPSLVFMAKVGSRSIGAYCDYTQYQPRVLAVIGPYSSEVALVTGKFFSWSLVSRRHHLPPVPCAVSWIPMDWSLQLCSFWDPILHLTNLTGLEGGKES